MQYAFGRGRKFRTQPKFDAKNPFGIAICDGCGFLVQHKHLREKKDYRGGSVPVGLGLYVCASCDDVPQPYYRRQLLRPDPVPLRNPRPDYNPTWYILDEDNVQIIAQENAQSVDTLTIETGTQYLTIDIGLAVNIPSTVLIGYDATNYMVGTVVNYVPSTGALVVTVTDVVGSGIYSSWTINLYGRMIQV